MKKETSYKLDDHARLWLRDEGLQWRSATPDESDSFYLCYPEIAAQAFWNTSAAKDGEGVALAA